MHGQREIIMKRINGLRSRRTRRGLSQQQLADLCSVNVNTIRYMEAGRESHGPSAQRVADFLETDLDVLYMNVIEPQTLHPRQRERLGFSDHAEQPSVSEAGFTPLISREALGV
jgi:transcriptional regulator with XRE-family HTH domain